MFQAGCAPISPVEFPGVGGDNLPTRCFLVTRPATRCEGDAMRARFRGAIVAREGEAVKTHSTLRALTGALILALGSHSGLRAQDRMPPIQAEKMTDAQRTAAAEFRAARNADPNGPFGVLLRVPDLMTLGFKWREHVQFRSALDQKLTEFSILIAARQWTQEYEWNAHYPAALKAGLKPDIVAAVAEGRRPAQMADDEAILYDFCTELHMNQSVSDATYARALAKFGESGIVEAASIEGYYTLLAMVMNVARTPLPAGAKPPLAQFPH
jgi:4-carboxymuconolactone decarboxylase